MEVFKRPQFLLDLARELTRLNTKAGADVAERWYQGLSHTIDELARHPFLGRERLDLKSKNIRSWRVNDFPHWLVLYTVRDEALILLRVCNGARKLEELEMKG